MTLLRRLVPQTLLLRTFLLVSALIFVSVATWIALFALARQEPQARQLGQLAVSVVNLTNAALVAAEPAKRVDLLRDLANSEGVHVYPAEPDDEVIPLPDSPFFRTMLETTQSQLGPSTRLASSINGQSGIWISFSVDQAAEDVYWLMLPGRRAESEFPWHWLGWGCASLILALLVAWLIVSRVTLPLRALAEAASEVGRGRHPDPIDERGAIELRQLAQAFNAMSEDLKRINAERAEVLAGLSHDLRTPLARLRLEAELSIDLDHARDAVIDDIEQMDAIIGQFLDFARGEGGETPEPGDINEIVAQVAEAHGRRATPPDLTLGDLPPVSLRRKALTRAIVNLLENARKYGGEPLEIATRCDGREIQIDILDRGPGIPPNEVERLKRPFTRLESARTDTTGTGLGLAIVDRIARLHAGSLELLQREGGGLIARLRLPID